MMNGYRLLKGEQNNMSINNLNYDCMRKGD